MISAKDGPSINQPLDVWAASGFAYQSQHEFQAATEIYCCTLNARYDENGRSDEHSVSQPNVAINSDPAIRLHDRFCGEGSSAFLGL